MTTLKAVATIIFVIAVSAVAYLFIVLAPDGWAHGSDWSDSDLISVFLASVTIVLTVLAAILGLGAFFGYREIKNTIEIHVENKVEDEISKRLPQVAREQFREFVQREALINFMDDDND